MSTVKICLSLSLRISIMYWMEKCFSLEFLTVFSGKFRNGKAKKNLYRNSKVESSMICPYVCQSFLFVQPIRSSTWLCYLVICLYMQITSCLLLLLNQIGAESCQLVSWMSIASTICIKQCIPYLVKANFTYSRNHTRSCKLNWSLPQYAIGAIDIFFWG